jgi:hypothetical protein
MVLRMVNYTLPCQESEIDAIFGHCGHKQMKRGRQRTYFVLRYFCSSTSTNLLVASVVSRTQLLGINVSAYTLTIVTGS